MVKFTAPKMDTASFYKPLKPVHRKLSGFVFVLFFFIQSEVEATC